MTIGGGGRTAIVAHADYDDGLVAAIGEALDRSGADVRGLRVLLKPNLVEPDPTRGVNTDPRFVRAAIDALRDRGVADLVVGEGSGHRRDTAYLLHASGLAPLLPADVAFVDLNLDDVERVPIRNGCSRLEELWLPVTVLRSDLVVSMPKLKTHHWAGATLSLKNCFGCVPGRVYGWPKNALHWAGLDEAIVDVAFAVAPGLALVDGIMGMEGNGPIHGRSVAAGVVVAGTDPVAVDATCCRVMGIDPTEVAHLRRAAALAGTDLTRSATVGAAIDDVRLTFTTVSDPRATMAAY